MSTYPVVEQGGSRPGRWLRAKRFQIALLIGVLETLVILLTDATWRWALVVAAAIFVFHIWVGRKSRHETVRQLSWAAAGSQVLPVLVPVVAALFMAVAVAIVVVLAIAIGVMLFLDRK